MEERLKRFDGTHAKSKTEKPTEWNGGKFIFCTLSSKTDGDRCRGSATLRAKRRLLAARQENTGARSFGSASCSRPIAKARRNKYRQRVSPAAEPRHLSNRIDCNERLAGHLRGFGRSWPSIRTPRTPALGRFAASFESPRFASRLERSNPLPASRAAFSTVRQHPQRVLPLPS